MSALGSLRMNNGVSIPRLALGTFSTSNAEISGVIETALSSGYRHLDCAWCYGNEKGIGEGLANQLKQGTVQRSDLFITSKLWCTFHRPERVRQQCVVTINDLQCEYLDLFLIHWPMALADRDPSQGSNDDDQVKLDNDSDFTETWKAMEALVDEGLVKSIGVSNFTEEQIERVLQMCKYKPVVNQVELHPYCPQTELDLFCKKHGILLEAYAPLGAKDRAWKTANDPEILDDPTVKALAEKYAVHPALILLRYVIDRDIVCVVKSANHQRIKGNFHMFDEKPFKLSQEDFDRINQEIQTRFRYYKMGDCKDAREYPFKDWKDSIPGK